MVMRIKEVADLVGISVRTLHYYDKIGLLKPDEIAETGYRLYSDDNLSMLQQILFFKELGLPLKKIKEIVHNPSFDRLEALTLHRDMLLEKRRRIDKMVQTIDKTIKHLEGEIEMSNEEKFTGFDFSENRYEEEARKRWGDDTVDLASEKINRLSTEEKNKVEAAMNDIFQKLANLRKLPSESEEVQKVIGEWFSFLNKLGSYSLEALKELGEMYVADERFTKNIDQFGEGLASFMRDAIIIYVNMHKA